MQRSKALGLILVVALTATQIIHCSGKDKGTTPTPSTVQMSGTLSFPNLSTVALSDITVGFGSNETSPDTSGRFRITGNTHVVGVAMAYDQDMIPMLMSVCPDPTANTALGLDVHSTAISMAFLDPYICNTDPAHAGEIVQRIETLPELTEFEDLLAGKLAADPKALGSEDAEIDSGLSRLVLAYYNSYPQEVSKRIDAVTGAISTGRAKLATSPPEIDPSYTKSGLQLTWVSGNTYKITNSYGRWCYACTPDDSFFVFPNGDLLDWIRQDRPFPPSERKFDMEVTAGQDTSWVEIYGYGFWGNPANAWDSLSHAEKNCVHAGGITTVTMELFTSVVSALCNTPRVFGNEKIAKLWGRTGWGFITDNARIVQRLEEYIKADNPIGASWWLTKQIMSQFVNSADYRAFLCQATGLQITEGMLGKIGAILNVPAKVVITTNNLTSVFKAVLALRNAYFATYFKVWREWEDYGSISGQVAAKNSGTGISGATVTLAGDENNPLNPAHQVTTDAQGHYRFDNIGVGSKELTASKSGFTTNTATVTVVKDQTVTANIQLEAAAAGLSGRVLNEIFVNNSVSPANFRGTVDITAQEIGGQNQTLGTHAIEGVYSLSLTPGNWWVVATHADYKSDSVSISVSGSGSAAPPRDLVLKPDPKMTGSVSINTDNQPGYEINFEMDFPQVGLTKPQLYTNPCIHGGQPQNYMGGIGMRGYSGNDYDWLELDLNSALITESGDFHVGGSDYFGCTGFNSPAMIVFGTTRAHCLYYQAYSFPMSYQIMDGPNDYGCNCGVGFDQTVTITEWGTELGDIVAGRFVVNLPGSTTCECSGNDTNGDGVVDHWDVGCSQVMVEMEFRLLVGSDYLVTFRPNGSPSLTGNSDKSLVDPPK